MMTRWRHRAATTYQMAAIPEAFAHNTGMRLGANGSECCGEWRKQDERYEFAHGSILERSQTYVGGERYMLLCLCDNKLARQQAGSDVD